MSLDNVPCRGLSVKRPLSTVRYAGKLDLERLFGISVAHAALEDHCPEGRVVQVVDMAISLPPRQIVSQDFLVGIQHCPPIEGRIGPSERCVWEKIWPLHGILYGESGSYRCCYLPVYKVNSVLEYVPKPTHEARRSNKVVAWSKTKLYLVRPRAAIYSSPVTASKSLTQGKKGIS